MNPLIERLALKFYPWLKINSSNSDVVISTRVRIARNIEGFNFPEKADVDTRSEIVDTIFEAVEKLPMRKKVYKSEIENLSEKEKKILLERKMLTFESLFDFECGVIFEENEGYSILLNEEDHLHIQCLEPGLNLSKCWKVTEKLEEQLAKFLKFSFNNDLGYLTSSPANVGTGLKASVYLDLTGAFLTGQLSGIIHSAKVSGHSIDPESGEQDYKGSRYILCNKQTLGISETESIKDFEGFVADVIQAELTARRKILADLPQRILNHVGRAYGLLKSSWILPEEEAFDCLMTLRTGINMGLFDKLDLETLNDLIIYTGDAHLQNSLGRDLMPEDLDIARAEFFKKKLAS